MSFDVYLVSNGPGELSAWVKPVWRRLRLERPDARITVALVPCPYASGSEAEAVAGWAHAPVIWTPRETLAAIAFGRSRSGPGVVVFLGGDQLFAVALAKRLRLPLLVYTDGLARWRFAVWRFLAADADVLARWHLPAHRASLVGNLMIDSVSSAPDPMALRLSLGLRADAPVLGLLPGSKPFKIRWVTPLFLRVAECLQTADPSLQVVLHRSAFTSLDDLAGAAANADAAAVTGGVTGHFEGDFLVTQGGARVQVLDPAIGHAGMGIADVALTVPGTNTAELAVLGVPTVIVLPLHKPEAIPLDGLLGRIGHTPGVGKPLMGFLANRFLARAPLVGLPNQRAGRMITPELIGTFSPEQVAETVATLVANPLRRREISDGLKQAMGEPGAASRVIAAIGETLEIRFPG